MHTARAKRALIAGSLALLSSLAMTSRVKTDDDNAGEHDRSTVIVSVTVDFAVGEITIVGKNFPSRPSVKLDGTLLNLISNNPTEIVASLEGVAGLENQPGDYLLTVVRRREDKGEEGARLGASSTFVVTIGATGPAGSSGPRGPQGDTGPQGAPGVFSGHFQSPNGAYSLDVTNNGIVLTGPAAKIQLVAGTATVSGVQVNVHGDSTVVINGTLVTIN